MRCDEVAQELSAPSGRLDHDAMAAHLAECPRCADWLEKMESLDRLWETTRPAEPPTVAFDQVWANLSQTLASEAPEAAVARNGRTYPATAAVLPIELKRSVSVPWPWMAGLMAPLAVAAALWLAFRAPTREASTVSHRTKVAQLERQSGDPGPTEIALSSFDFDQGGIAIIHIGEDGPPRIEERPLTPVSDTETIAASFDMLNYVETLSDFQGSL